LGNVYALADAARENQSMSATKPEWLLDTGILQFGYFVVDNRVAPVRFCPEYLPAFPELLAEVGKLALQEFNAADVDHLIATADSVPLGLVCSLQTNLSLVYSRGMGEAAVYDLVGSYNSGHKCALLINTANDAPSLETFVKNAHGVGLEVQVVVALLEIKPANQTAEIPVRSVFRLSDVVHELVANARLLEGQSQAVLQWLDELE
jgi:hypothetical protein